jgi:hypothetical protein
MLVSRNEQGRAFASAGALASTIIAGLRVQLICRFAHFTSFAGLRTLGPMIPTRKVHLSHRRPRGRTTPQNVQARKEGAAAGFADDSSSSSERPGAGGIGPHAFAPTSLVTRDGLTGDCDPSRGLEQIPKRARTANTRVFLPTGSNDPFLETLKKQQLSRLENPACGLDDIDVTKSGSRDQGDPSTTNLFIGQLVRIVDMGLWEVAGTDAHRLLTGT